MNMERTLGKRNIIGCLAGIEGTDGERTLRGAGAGGGG